VLEGVPGVSGGVYGPLRTISGVFRSAERECGACRGFLGCVGE